MNQRSPNSHWLRESQLFLRFAATAGLGVAPETLKRGSGFDIVCESVDGSSLAFELTEAVDTEWARAMGALNSGYEVLRRKLYAEDDLVSARVRLLYHDHDLRVSVVNGAGSRDLRQVVDELFLWLAASSPVDLNDCAVPPAVSSVVLSVRAAHFPGINRAIMHIDGQSAWLKGDAVTPVRKKFSKNYPSGIGLQLLVFYAQQPASPASNEEVNAWLDSGLPSDVFAHVWVYDALSDRILLSRRWSSLRGGAAPQS